MLRCRVASSAVTRVAAVSGAAAVAARACLSNNSSVMTSVALPQVTAMPAASFRFNAAKVDPEGAKKSGAYLLDKTDVLARVTEVVKNFEKVDASKVTAESHFINDLGLDSLDVVEVVMALEQEFVLDIPDHEAEKIQSIPDAVDYLASNPMAK